MNELSDEIIKYYKFVNNLCYIDIRETKLFSNSSYRIKYNFSNGCCMVLTQRGFTKKDLYLYTYDIADIKYLPDDFMIKGSICSSFSDFKNTYGIVDCDEGTVFISGGRPLYFRNTFPKVFLNSRLTKEKLFECSLTNDITMSYDAVQTAIKVKSLYKTPCRELRYNYKTIDLEKLKTCNLEEFLCSVQKSVKNCLD